LTEEKGREKMLAEENVKKNEINGREIGEIRKKMRERKAED
jgi:hypothetical protein